MVSERSDRALNEHTAAIKIQSVFRGFFARKKYAIKQIPELSRESYRVLIKGNDPVITGLPLHDETEQVALIGTSGMRSVEIACQLSSGSPKLIIIDNSKQVVEFWRGARDLIAVTGCPRVFLLALSVFVEQNKCYRSNSKRQDFTYLQSLVTRYGFKKLQQIIGNATVLAQSWADKDTMVKVKNILAVTGIETIYAYPSNIVAYLRSDGQGSTANQVLDNIQLLNPTLAIHTDMVCGKPQNILITNDHTFAFVSEQLKLDSQYLSSPSAVA